MANSMILKEACVFDPDTIEKRTDPSKHYPGDMLFDNGLTVCASFSDDMRYLVQGNMLNLDKLENFITSEISGLFGIHHLWIHVVASLKIKVEPGFVRIDVRFTDNAQKWSKENTAEVIMYYIEKLPLKKILMN